MRTRLTLSLAALLATTGTLFGLGRLLSEPTAHTERRFPIHSIESAPEASRDSLEYVQAKFQMVPHLAGVMAASPALLRSYTTLQDNLEKHGGLTPAENNVVQLSIALENECQYCVAGHTMAGKMFFENTDDELAALRSGSKLPAAKLDALRTFALAVYETQGRVEDAQLEAFLAAGYTRAQALDVVANVSAKVMSNFANQLARTPVDVPFAAFAEGLPFAEERALLEASE